MVDNSVKAVVVIALGGALAAGWLSNNPEQGKALLAMMRGADPAPAAAAPVHASQPLFPSAPPRQQATRAAPIVSAGYGREELKADQGGQFQSDVEIEGSRIHMLVDTGATFVSLSYEDAEKLGFSPAPADYTVTTHTANGIVMNAKMNLREVRLGTLMVSNVPAVVMPKNVRGVSLLGMSFLKKLGGFEVASDTLIMRQ